MIKSYSFLNIPDIIPINMRVAIFHNIYYHCVIYLWQFSVSLNSRCYKGHVTWVLVSCLSFRVFSYDFTLDRTYKILNILSKILIILHLSTKSGPHNKWVSLWLYPTVCERLSNGQETLIKFILACPDRQ